MSKRLICTERPLAALGREDVMKRVFFLCREKPAAGVVVVGGWRIQGVDVASGTAAAPGPTTPHLIYTTGAASDWASCHLSSLTWHALYEHHMYRICTVEAGWQDERMWRHYVRTRPRTCLLSALSRLWGWSASHWCGTVFVLCCLKRGKFKCCLHSGLRAGQAGRVG